MSSNDDKWKKFAEGQEDLDDQAVEASSKKAPKKPKKSKKAKSPESDSQPESESSEDSLYGIGIDFPSRENLEDQLTAMERKVDEYKNQSIRAQAELENVRRRAERDVSNAHKYGTEKLLSELLPVVDSLLRGLEGPEPADEHAKNMRHGLQLTLDLLEKTLQKFGIEPIAPEQGEAFNPEFHEAMSMVEDPNGKSNTILQVIQKGYHLNGRVIRAAMVVVVK